MPLSRIMINFKLPDQMTENFIVVPETSYMYDPCVRWVLKNIFFTHFSALNLQAWWGCSTKLWSGWTTTQLRPAGSKSTILRQKWTVWSLWWTKPMAQIYIRWAASCCCCCCCFCCTFSNKLVLSQICVPPIMITHTLCCCCCCYCCWCFTVSYNHRFVCRQWWSPTPLVHMRILRPMNSTLTFFSQYFYIYPTPRIGLFVHLFIRSFVRCTNYIHAS